MRARECSGLEHRCSRVFQFGFKWLTFAEARDIGLGLDVGQQSYISTISHPFGGKNCLLGGIARRTVAAAAIGVENREMQRKKKLTVVISTGVLTLSGKSWLLGGVAWRALATAAIGVENRELQRANFGVRSQEPLFESRN